MFIISLLLNRINVPIGESNTLSFLTTEEELDNFLLIKNYSFIIFSDFRYVLDSLNFGIYKYKNLISFSYATFNLSNKYGCLKSPCFVPFKGNNEIKTDPVIPQTSTFAFWLKRLISSNIIEISNVEEIRFIISQNSYSIFLIDLEEIPKFLPKDYKIYLVKKNLFKQYGINLDSGCYIYRPIDRQILLFNQTFENTIKTNLILPISTLYEQKQYFCGFFVDETNLNETNDGINLINFLSNKFINNFSFSILGSKEHENFIHLGGLRIAEKPFLVIFESKNINNKRWILQKQDWNNYDYFINFFNNISNKIQPYSLISLPLPNYELNETFKELVSINFDENVMNKNYDVLVVLTASWCHHCHQFKPILKKASELLKNENIKFYWIDGTKNEMPSYVPEYQGFPITFLWPANNKSNIIEFDKNRNLEGIFNFGRY